MSLYQKHRPRTFERVVGNSQVVKTLSTMVENREKCPHAFLLHGPTGCGKTTLARIIARMLGSSGSDMSEVDSADYRGIDTVRDIRKNSQFMPAESETRVWIIDECHKMTNDAQNALLKILEDSPKLVYFILCTTEPQKLLPTLKGRCSAFQVKPLTNDEMSRLLKRVVKKEGEQLDEKVYDLIIENNRGLPRNSLQVLEQVLNVSPENRLEIAKKSEEEINESIELCRALLKRANWKTISKILKGLKDQDPEGIRRVVLGYCQSVLLGGQDLPICGLILEEFTTPFYDSGFPQLVYACYSVTKNG